MEVRCQRCGRTLAGEAAAGETFALLRDHGRDVQMVALALEFVHFADDREQLFVPIDVHCS